MTDMDRFIEAADALAEAADDLSHFAFFNMKGGRQDLIDDAAVKAREYRAAREAITQGTPPAFATSA